ncbi:hypothetical protein H072_9792 [Dactylellina haptotyla CBS 200.50]|uniref:F-box domain-containing protein n=1 Tax=Dactylellina haptotyla (strain CBS 200.50) TaxID=1284197 RepID=S8A0W9_DACHA|nr:hypothetical protein H072_9792 [Dactylellina haptotyla CBS 200.50]
MATSQSRVLLDLPQEILLSILSHLLLEEIRKFSECSRACSKVSFELRFRKITFGMRRFQHFTPDGPMGWILGVVRHIELKVDEADELNHLLPALENFEKIDIMTIGRGYTAFCENNVFIATMTGLSKLKFYDDIKRLEYHFYYRRRYLPTTRASRAHCQDLLGQDAISLAKGIEMVREGMRYPSNVKDISILLPVPIVTRRWHFENELSLYPIRACPDTVTLHLGSGTVTEREVDEGTYLPILMFPNIKKLRLQQSRGPSPTKDDLKGLENRFPNLEILQIHSKYSLRSWGELPCHDLANLGHLPKLREVELFWSRMLFISIAECKELEDKIKKWKANGLPALTRVVLIRSWYTSSWLFRTCTITRNEKGDIELEWTTTGDVDA